MISGNHDGAELIAYGARILDKSGLHMSPVYDGSVSPFTMKDDYGELDVYMLPFVRKVTLRTISRMMTCYMPPLIPGRNSRSGLLNKML